MADEEERVTTPNPNHTLPAQRSSDDERKAEGDEVPQHLAVPLENDTNGEAQEDIEEPLTGYLRGWRLHVLTAAFDHPKQSAIKPSSAKISIDYV